MGTKYRIILLMAITFILANCNKDYLSTTPPQDNPTPPPPAGTALSFKDYIVPIFTSNCLGSGCHISGGQSPVLTSDKAYDQLTGMNFVDPNDTIYTNSKLYQRMAGTTKPMPPIGKLPQSKLDLVGRWIQEGSQNN